MLTPLAFPPTTLTAHWMDSPLPAAAFDLTSHFGLPSPFPDAGRASRVYYPVRPLDSEGVYRSPKIAFKKQVVGVSCRCCFLPSTCADRIEQAANKKDPRWKHAGIGLGVGLSGVETRWGVLQYSYTLSRPPKFVRPARDQSQKAATPESVKVEAPAASLWNTLTEFLDTTYSLLSPPDSPTLETAIPLVVTAQDASFESTHQASPVADITPTPPHAPPAVDAVPSPVEVLALEPIDFTALKSPILNSPSPASPKRSFSPVSYPSVLSLASLSLDNTPIASQQQTLPAAVKLVRDITRPALRVSFAISDSARTAAERPQWFAREEARAADMARRFHIGRNVTPWDRRRAKCALVEQHLAENELRARAAEMEAEAHAERSRLRLPALTRLRFTLCGLSYTMIVRQQRRRAEGELEIQAQRVRWLRREEELAREERRERIREMALEAACVNVLERT